MIPFLDFFAQELRERRRRLGLSLEDRALVVCDFAPQHSMKHFESLKREWSVQHNAATCRIISELFLFEACEWSWQHRGFHEPLPYIYKYTHIYIYIYSINIKYFSIHTFSVHPFISRVLPCEPRKSYVVIPPAVRSQAAGVPLVVLTMDSMSICTSWQRHIIALLSIGDQHWNCEAALMRWMFPFKGIFPPSILAALYPDLCIYIYTTIYI